MRTDEISKEIEKIEDDTIKKVYRLLRTYNKRIDDYLIDIVSGLCDVPTESMLTVANRPQCAHARWFFWYVYRYMNGCNYDSVVEMMRPYRIYSRSMVEYAVCNMTVMISNEPIWKKRWYIMKEIIDIILNNENK